MKLDDSVHMCNVYKLTVNRDSQLERNPVPKIETLFAVLAGGQLFTRLDISCAYQQMVLEEDFKQYVTVNTHKGRFKYNQLLFGVFSAPAVFQRTTEGWFREFHVWQYIWMLY